MCIFICLFWLHWNKDPGSLQDLSSPTRDQTMRPTVEAQSLNHWTAREVPWLSILTRLLWCMEFSRQEYWSGLPFPSPGYLPNPGIEPGSPALQADLYCLSHQGSPILNTVVCIRRDWCISWRVSDEDSMKAENDIVYSVLQTLSIKLLSPRHRFIMLTMSVLLAPLCPYITALHCLGGQFPPPPTLAHLPVMRAGMFLLDSTYLTTEIVLGKTAGPNTVSRPHFLPRGVAEGWPRDPSPESSSGIFAAWN